MVPQPSRRKIREKTVKSDDYDYLQSYQNSLRQHSKPFVKLSDLGACNVTIIEVVENNKLQHNLRGFSSLFQRVLNISSYFFVVRS